MSADFNKTPMIQQYWEFRNKLPPNTLLFFRVGDFYEMFGADAERGAELLGLTLTRRSGTPLAGVPYHALQTYLQKALNAGVKIAICEQAETPKPGKLVRRALVRIVTPGTTLDDAQLDAKSNNYILALDDDRRGLHAAWIDVSTAEFRVASSQERAALLASLQISTFCCSAISFRGCRTGISTRGRARPRFAACSKSTASTASAFPKKIRHSVPRERCSTTSRKRFAKRPGIFGKFRRCAAAIR